MALERGRNFQRLKMQQQTGPRVEREFHEPRDTAFFVDVNEVTQLL
jgi:hypothetical protein